MLNSEPNFKTCFDYTVMQKKKKKLSAISTRNHMIVSAINDKLNKW